MSFGAILALLIAGLVAAPIVAHLLRRRRTEVRDFPPARLVPIATPLARRRARLEDRALFGVRALAVLALAVLGATPFVSCSRLDLGRRGGGSIALVLVLDDSMSMRAKLGRGTRFARAKDAALELAASLHEGDAIAIVGAGSPARITLATTSDLVTARAAIAGAKESDRASDLDGALVIATSLARALPQPDRRVVVLSDLADGRPNGSPIGEGSEVPIWVPLTELRGRAPDCGLVRATARGGAVRAHVACGAPEDAAGRAVAVYAGATLLAERPLAAASVQDVDVAIPESSLGATLHARLTGTDAIDADDAAPVVAASGALIVAVVADLSQTGVVTGGPSAVEQAVAAIDETLPLRPLPTIPDHVEDLAPFSAVILDDPPGMTPESRAAFRAWLERGGVALALLGPRAGGAILGAAFDPFVPGAVRWTQTAPEGADPASVSALGATGEGMTSLAAKGRALLDARADAATTPLAKWSDGQPLLFTRAVGRGTAFVATLPGSLDASDFPLRPAFLELLTRVIDAGRARATGRRGVVGSTWTFPDAAPSRVLGPGGPVAVRDHGGVKTSTPELAGAYAVEFRDAVEVRVAEIEEREVDLRPRAAAKEATSEALGSQKARIDGSPYVAFVLLFALLAESALRVWTRLREREAALALEGRSEREPRDRDDHRGARGDRETRIDRQASEALLVLREELHGSRDEEKKHTDPGGERADREESDEKRAVHVSSPRDRFVGSQRTSGSPSVRLGRRASGAGEDLVELLHRLRRQAQLERAERTGQVVERPWPHDRRGHRRVREHPRERDVPRIGAELGGEGLEALERRAVLRDRPLLEVAARPPALLLLQRAAEHPALQRAPRQEPEPVRLARRNDLELDRAIEKIVETLLRDEPEEVPGLRRLLRLREVEASEVRGADVEHLPVADENLHRLPDLFPRRLSVDVVHLVEIDVIGLQPLERAFAGLPDVKRGELRVVRSVAHWVVDLRREDDLLAPPAALREPASDDLLGPPFAALPAVDVGGVEEVDPEVERLVHDDERVGLARLRTEVHRAEAKPADAETRATEADVAHGAKAYP